MIRLLVLSSLALAGCPAGGVPGIPGKGGAAKNVDPNTCGNYAATDVGKKLKGFLEATLTLEKAVKETDVVMTTACNDMAKELGIEAEGDVKTVCQAVADKIKDNISTSVTAGATLNVEYKPAECTVNVDAAASVAASCEASASADVTVSCSGTCQGTCEGTCEGSTGEGGECNGVCQGTCKGTCEGSAEVEASAECSAQAEIKANVEAECTEPELTIEYDAGVVVDQGKVDQTVAALKTGLPRVLKVGAMVNGPVKSAFKGWAKATKELAGSTAELYRSLDDQAACVAGQLGAAANMVAGIGAAIDVQVEVSVSVSASASAEGSASGGASASN